MDEEKDSPTTSSADVVIGQAIEEEDKQPEQTEHFNKGAFKAILTELTAYQTMWAEEPRTEKEIKAKTQTHLMWKTMLGIVFDAVKKGGNIRAILGEIAPLFIKRAMRESTENPNTDDYISFVEALTSMYETASRGEKPKEISEEIWRQIGTTLKMIPLGAVIGQTGRQLPVEPEPVDIKKV